MFRLVRWLLALSCVLLAGPAGYAQNRVALVIGNDSYQSVNPLKNARADARAIAKAFEKVGFKVLLRLDQSEKSMKDAVRTFKGMVAGGDVAVFYFSGHGVQLGGANFLLPVDIRGDSEDQVRDEAIPLQRVLDDLVDQKAKFSLAIIDACRNNPFRTKGRALGGRGLAVTSAATGQMVLFSAGTGQQALDSLGPNDHSPNGVFTRVLLKEMDKPGVPVDKVLRETRDEVVKLSTAAGQEQVPALYDQALGEFYFIPAPAKGGPAAVQPARVEAPSGLGAPPVASALVGGLQISVNVPGAEVYVDGAHKGSASPTEALNLRDLPVGKVTVKVEAQGYQARTQTFDIGEGQWTQAKIVLGRQGETPAQPPPTKSFWSKLIPGKSGPATGPGADGTAASNAAMSDKVDVLKELQAAGGPINAVDKWGLTPLHWTVYYKKYAAMNFLLENGADPNLLSTKSFGRVPAGGTALILAAYYGNDEAMAALLKHRANAGIANADGKTALDYATTYRFEACVQLLKGR